MGKKEKKAVEKDWIDLEVLDLEVYADFRKPIEQEVKEEEPPTNKYMGLLGKAVAVETKEIEKFITGKQLSYWILAVLVKFGQNFFKRYNIDQHSVPSKHKLFGN